MISKRLILVAVTVAFALATLPFCSDDSEITEVGNPTSTATTNGTVAALSSGVDGLLSGQADAALLRDARGLAKGGVRDEDFSCSYEVSSESTICNCPLGGTMTTTFIDDGPIIIAEIVNFTNEADMEFDDCTISECGEEVSLTGSAHVSISGTLNPSILQGETTTVVETDDPCSGMTSGDQDYGFSMTLTSSGISSHEFSGTLCLTEPVSFDSLDELHAAFDPEGTCSTNE